MNTTIRDYVEWLIGGNWDSNAEEELLRWPPDIFAISASLLQLSGGYLDAVMRRRGAVDWASFGVERPSEPKSTEAATPKHPSIEWATLVEGLGELWCKAYLGHETDQEEFNDPTFTPRLKRIGLPSSTPDNCIPKAIRDCWKKLSDAADTSLSSLCEYCGSVAAQPGSVEPSDRSLSDLCDALLILIGAADEACAGAGITPHVRLDPRSSQLEIDAAIQLYEQLDQTAPSTLCRRIAVAKAIVLPKMRVPQTGISVRSLTHHLALLRGGEVYPHWLNFSAMPPKHQPHVLTVLFLPWPLNVQPSQFHAVPESQWPSEVDPEHFGFFKFEPKGWDQTKEDRIAKAIEQAMRQVAQVDALLMPELALRHEDFEKLCQVAMKAGVKVVIAGVVEPGDTGDKNEAYFALNCGEDSSGHKLWTHWKQTKHHRWQLDARQIRQYGLGARLNPKIKWWERLALTKRHIDFILLDDLFSLSVLICEDLAQSEPIREVIQAVGPNLIVCLLADGPQLQARWPGRYATGLADDPGSSVLTVTSLGMSRLSRAFNGASDRSDVVALWRDPINGTTELELPAGADALVLSINTETQTEYSADGRHDYGAAGTMTLSGIYPLFVGGET